ncbi:hypothetical protein C5167_031155 [Papaver somniferum]|nr:hypothetical protein C5167_031155 [Papaver somniferum]
MGSGDDGVVVLMRKKILPRTLRKLSNGRAAMLVLHDNLAGCGLVLGLVILGFQNYNDITVPTDILIFRLMKSCVDETGHDVAP